MKMIRSLIVDALAILFVVSLATSQEGHRIPDSVLNRTLKGLDEGAQVDIWPYYIKLSSAPENLSPGDALINFSYSPKRDCQDLKIVVSEIENLNFFGDQIKQLSALKGDTVTATFHVRIPANDTSGFRFEIDYCGHKQVGYNYFVADEKSVSWTSQNLSKTARTKPPRQRPENPYMRFERPLGTIDTGYRYVTILADSDVFIQIPVDSFNAWELQAKDTALERRIDSLRTIQESYLKQAEKAKELRYELGKQFISRDEYILQRFLESKDSGLDWRVQKGMTKDEIIKRNAAIHAERMREDTTQFRLLNKTRY
ncbi:MAG: hypothetical protein ACREBV_07000 [Candidatus Zixiibacteriota bacterium]